MIRKVLTLIVFVLIFSSVPAFAGNAEKEKAAVAAAEQWLKGVDSGKYSESWGEAAELFKNAVKQEQWEQSLQAVRKPLGKMVSRKVRTKTFAASLPGAPDAEYVVIEFKTSFENKKSAAETVTPMMDKDGKWRVSGYYIK
ncbi:MAG: DUF4019 domain-containing protein [Nitrospirae bacterium]|nr:MAG: DUF4019 domain-containing protein [Nitrospirota bacterium]